MNTHTFRMDQLVTNSKSLEQYTAEPFRLFFPLATLTGLIGVALWPFHLLGMLTAYPGLIHARIMVHGMFGGFIIGFLATAMPRMLSAQKFSPFETCTLLCIHLLMVGAYAFDFPRIGDAGFIFLLGTFVTFLVPRFLKREDLPPPGFVLVVAGLLSGMTGALLGFFQIAREVDLAWITLQRLLSYHGFVLLPIVGISPFLLPRFFGMPSKQNFPEMLRPSRIWVQQAMRAGVIGVGILGSFALEAAGFVRSGNTLRALLLLYYIFKSIQFGGNELGRTSIARALKFALGSIPLGYLGVAFFPGYRVPILHITFLTGFSLLTFVVATRVVFGHSGQIEKLRGKLRFITVVAGLSLLAVATRISADVWPKVMWSHYIYAALIWIAAVVLWGWKVLRNVAVFEEERK